LNWSQYRHLLQAQAAHAVNLSDNQEDVILQSVIAKLQTTNSQHVEKWRLSTAKSDNNTAF
jgi:hypothetical protein